MNIEGLVSEGEALARPAFLLNTAPTDSGIVGYWGGERGDMPNEMPPPRGIFSGRRHILSLSENITARIGITCGPVSFFEWTRTDGGDLSYRVGADHRLRFADLSFTGEPLYATAAQSFPPFAAVCLYGGERVGAWLRELGLARHEYWKAGGDLPELYEGEWQKRSPFYERNADVVVGGWHFLWPDDDFYIPLEMQLVALTLRDAEPWFEIWHSPARQGWRAKPRTT